ncbi:MAG TPA: pilin [Luteibacter sp.]|nr:pilin [Luteibacter sp.]
MSDVQDIWVGQNGEKLGPFSEVTVRKGMLEGTFAPDALGWRTGMASWASLATMMRDEVPLPPPPPPLSTPPQPPVLRAVRPIAPQPQQRYYRRESSRAEVTLPEAAYNPPPQDYYRSPSLHAGQPDAPRSHGGNTDRSAIPAPPTLHWAMTAVFSFLSLGLFGMVWRFIQARWVRKIDGKNWAMLYFALGLAAFVGALLVTSPVEIAAPGQSPVAPPFSVLQTGLLLATLAFYLVGYFSMAASIRRLMRAHGEPLETSDILLLFFHMYYIQGQLTWIGRWKRTGRTKPPPPKATMWLLPITQLSIMLILAAIAMPTYQSYLVRGQGMESVSTSADARNHVANFYARYKRYPKDNAEATLPAGTKIKGQYVSQVEVEHGKVTVYYDSVKASPELIGKHIVFTPMPNGTQMTWECRSESDVDDEYLPKTCG